ncbi:hypothetical protein KIPB_009204 [Kipferlia bialata]|uniref:Uncharacterized protein n=1 Tax=Kipferlia bialata TaxID=797122 RepID=A0A9K3GLE5_9EUKA|nr:hypothetical protein KIPB_009204 [Kipferlia bialata]|eukprot:g9204.t1
MSNPSSYEGHHTQRSYSLTSMPYRPRRASLLHTAFVIDDDDELERVEGLSEGERGRGEAERGRELEMAEMTGLGLSLKGYSMSDSMMGGPPPPSDQAMGIGPAEFGNFPPSPSLTPLDGDGYASLRPIDTHVPPMPFVSDRRPSITSYPVDPCLRQLRRGSSIARLMSEESDQRSNINIRMQGPTTSSSVVSRRRMSIIHPTPAVPNPHPEDTFPGQSPFDKGDTGDMGGIGRGTEEGDGDVEME